MTVGTLNGKWRNRGRNETHTSHLGSRATKHDGVHRSPAPAWGTHRANHGDVDNLSVGQFFAVVPAVLVEPLPQDLDWGLGTILLPVMVGGKVKP